ncbi:MAG: hypothetical protein KC933_23580 [Myxococcales bacterium]|nr:hypothetical protein [Myxococcales bacterium]MCB9645705.1 hypothetical protein [Deltaproteobacteria bacterium]
MKRIVTVFALTLAAAACSGEDTPADAGPQYELPQILPDVAPLCLNYDLIRVGDVRSIPVQLENKGRQQLVIESVEVEGDTRGFFTKNGPDLTVVETYEKALVQLNYQPTAAGWDYAELVVKSNAENYPTLRISVLGRAAPEGDVDGGVENWDAGPKPPEATEDGGETCRDERDQ